MEAPRFPKGYPATIAFSVGLYTIVQFGMWYVPRYLARERAKQEKDAALDDDDGSASNKSVSDVLYGKETDVEAAVAVAVVPVSAAARPSHSAVTVL